MSTVKEPRWRRRSAFRGSEIAGAALAEFGARGFAGARVADIASRAGLSKAALYRYFPTKTDLFRAVLIDRAAPLLARALESGGSLPSFSDFVAALLPAMADAIATADLRRLVRLVVAEAENFPELALLWRESVVEPAIAAIAAVVERAQASGEVRVGDPRLMAFSVVGPLLMGGLWREVLEPAGAAPLDLHALASDHAVTLARGMTASGNGQSDEDA